MTEIGNYAFQNCKSLKEVSVGAGKIGSYCFEDCDQLEVLKLGDAGRDGIDGGLGSKYLQLGFALACTSIEVSLRCLRSIGRGGA